MSPTLIGAFVLGALALVVVAIVVLGSGKLLEHRYRYVLFFDRSVDGLRVGAPVKFRGVQIGAVSDIRLSLDKIALIHTQEFEIPVIIELEPDRFVRLGASTVVLDDPQTVPNMIARGLRAQLQLESLLTGLLYVSLDMKPDTAARMILPPNAPYQEIPTIPTQLELAQQRIEAIINDLEKADFAQLVHAATNAADAVQALVSSRELKNALVAMPPALGNVSHAALEIGRLATAGTSELAVLNDNLRVVRDEFAQTANHAQSVMGTVQNEVGPQSPLNYKLNHTLDEVADAARSVRLLADLLERNPSALVRGVALPDKDH